MIERMNDWYYTLNPMQNTIQACSYSTMRPF